MTKGTIENPLIGCDPEVFLFDRRGQLVDAGEYIPGDKLNPVKVKGGAVQVDGISAEFNIEPSLTFEEFNTNINDVVEQLYKMIPEGFVFKCLPNVEMPSKHFDALPPKSKELGCDPDYVSPSIVAREPWNRKGRWFCGSGHIHIGWGDGFDVDSDVHKTDAATVTHVFDQTWRVSPFLNSDGDRIRNEFYGRHGVYRPKRYGVECRSPSNKWLLHGAFRKNMFISAKLAPRVATSTKNKIPIWPFPWHNEHIYGFVPTPDLIPDFTLRKNVT